MGYSEYKFLGTTFLYTYLPVLLLNFSFDLLPEKVYSHPLISQLLVGSMIGLYSVGSFLISSAIFSGKDKRAVTEFYATHSSPEGVPQEAFFDFIKGELVAFPSTVVGGVFPSVLSRHILITFRPSEDKIELRLFPPIKGISLINGREVKRSKIII